MKKSNVTSITVKADSKKGTVKIKASDADKFHADILALQTTVKKRKEDVLISLTAYVYGKLNGIAVKYSKTVKDTVAEYNKKAPFTISYEAMRKHKSDNTTAGKEKRAEKIKAVKVNPVKSIINRLEKMTITEQATNCYKLYKSLASEAKAKFCLLAGLKEVKLQAVAKRVKK